MDAILLLNKKAGVTSFSCLRYVKKYVNKKTGHCGTLDRFAEGLIISCSGKYTKCVPLLTGFDKTYIAKIKFGEETDTLDPEGQVIYRSSIPSYESICSATEKLKGSIMQVPPAYSAIHVDGKRSYQIMRSGGEVELKARNVQIYSYEILEYNDGVLSIILNVSKGTYIRSYARDLALLCDSRAHLVSLTRSKIGPFSLSSAVDYDNEQFLERIGLEKINVESEKLLSEARLYALNYTETQ